VAALTYFTVTADGVGVVGAPLGSDPASVSIKGTVTFTPLITAGDALTLKTLSPRPALGIVDPIVANFDSTGQLKYKGAAVRLLADTAVLELSTPLFYRVDFTGLTVNGAPRKLTSFTFQAAAADAPVNLVTVARVPGQPASGITNTLVPDHVRLNIDGDVVFSSAGQDLPDPLTLTVTGVPGDMDDITDATTVGKAVVRAVDAAAARTAISAQASDSDLTAIAALTTTSFGRSLLTSADAAAVRTTVGAAGEGAVNVKDHGAVGDGVTDDTTAIAAAWTAAGNGHAIYFPPGSYVYNGTGLTAAEYDGHGAVLIAKGAGEFATTILLGSSSYLFAPGDVQLELLLLEDLEIRGGKGAIKHTRTGTDTIGTKHVNRVRFNNHTECAIATDCSDSPYWFINECWFVAANATSTINVALSPGLTDGCTITKCNFQKGRVHIKAGSGGNNLYISECNFYQEDTVNSGGPRIDVWIAPTTGSTNNAGNGFTCVRNKFGAENLVSTDYRIVYADQGSGATNGVKMPVLSADSTGYIIGHTVGYNFFQVNSDFYTVGAAGPSMIYSTTPNVADLAMPDNRVLGAVNYMLEFRTPPAIPNWINSRNTFGPLYGLTDTAHPGPKISNDPGAGYVSDPSETLQTRSNVVRKQGAGSSASYVSRLSTTMPSFTASNATVTGATDAYGGADAATVNITGDYGAAYAVGSNFVVGVPVWVEIDVAQPADTVLSAVRVSVQDSSPSLAGVEHWFRQLEIPTTAQGWVTYAFSFMPRTTGASPALLVGAPVGTGSGSTGKVKVGRPRMYQAHERELLQGRSSATKLTTARNIDGQAFDGSANITVIAPGTHAASSKTAPVDADEIPLVDSGASNVLKKLPVSVLRDLKPSEPRIAPALYDSFTAADGTALDSAKWTVTTGGAGAAAATTNTNRARFTTGATGGYSASDRVFAVSTLATSLADAEILVRHTFGAVATESYMIYALRCSTTDPQSSSTNYHVILSNFGVDLNKMVSGSQTRLSSATDAYTDYGMTTPSNGSIKWLRFRAKGTTVAFKMWDDGTPEPIAWTYSTTDSSVTAGGKVVACVSGGNAAASGIHYADQFHIYAL
jgi:hypothetical protein